MIRVVSAGLLTTVQDLGRWGHQDRGVPVAGPMDPFAHRRANRIAGNPDGAATLEITLAGPRLRVDGAHRFAICGADLPLRVNDVDVAGEGPFDIDPGTEIAIGRARRGARAYLAVRGGIDVPMLLGSRATHLPSRMGGLEGRPLRAGDALPVGGLDRFAAGAASTGLPSVALPDGLVRLRVLPGPEQALFAAGWVELLAAPFTVHPDSNRMGYRLSGPGLAAPAADGPSSATTMGTIQVTGAGHLILLMADRQTTGGYPRVANVIAADLGLAGQLKPGDGVSFDVCTAEAAREALVVRSGIDHAGEDSGSKRRYDSGT